jgi:signal transduction histidine kinase
MEMTEAMLRAEAASSAKSAFLANMSHELRTPLNAVIGFADLMNRELFGPLGNDHYRAYVADIIDSGSNLLSMIEAILEFSRSEHASLADVEAETRVEQVAEAVLRDVGPAASDRSIRITADVQEDMPAISVDETILYQILQNLVSNAIKFSPTGSTVLVRGFVAADGRPGVSVGDHGIGIPSDLIDKVTQPFWQRQGPLVRDHSGVGLGLAIVKSHVDALGGELLFDSAVDKGTTVTVLLPASRAVGTAPDAG